MRVRLGYVAISLNLPKVTSSSNVTYAYYSKLSSQEKKINKLKQTTLSNLDDLYKILKYNKDNCIHFYRVTSALVPLATHPEVNEWNYRMIFKKDFERLGKFIKENDMRIDTHPNEFNVINSVREEVVENTKRNLYFHVNFFKDIDYEQGKMIIHIGSGQKGKENSIERFITNFMNYPREITERIILENDDKVFNTNDVLNICNKLGVPMVLDIHHYVCNNEGENIEDLLPCIFNTWNNEKLPPKVHVSSPKNGEKDRKHADYINVHDFINFINMCKKVDRDIDVMIEAKKKDVALFKLVEDLKNIQPKWKWIDKTTFEI
ncbi:UV DNA damage repair endonuclease UvsE [Haloimpatiens sp. FM7330]|uniref:UV DNA damage repair endonuclease UvsE n=1 Tax=Haloimpatiens sp. FM7330 TaxID=3298610 RepID=UPI003644D270